MLQQVKEYLRINHEHDDDYIENLIRMSVDLIRTKTGVDYNTNDTIYKQAVLMCVAHYYDNRTSIVDKAIVEVPYTLNELIKTIGFRGKYVKQN